MAKRKYTKRSDYWNKFQKSNASSPVTFLKSEDYKPELVGDSLLSSASRLSDSTNRSKTRSNRVATNDISDKYANISAGMLPCEYNNGYIYASDAIILAQKAYFNVPVVKATIDLMSEFADSDIYLTDGTQKSKDFTEKLLEKININKIKEQFFREFYRSGNVFFHRLESKLTPEGMKTAVNRFGVNNVKSPIPTKYLLLNPAEIAAGDALYFDDYTWFKILTDYEIAKLKNPQTEEEKILRDSLPEELKKKLSSNTTLTTRERIYMPLSLEKLHAVFYKKQDYEPLAVPMVFPVLDDINKKMELKKVDQAIARSIENVILLVTMGAKPDEGGINHKNLSAMQSIFQNKSVGRVLVADYTTKAEFIIPDMKRVLGSEKYEILNRDINEGLQNITLGDSKNAEDAKLKLRVFFQRLDDARNVFLRDFLQPEINRVVKAVGLRNPPKANFVELDTMDNAALQKLVTRMMELGILSPEQGLDVINTGVFPESDSLDEAQEKFRKQREEGKFVPIMSGIQEKQIEIQEEQFEMQLEQDDKHFKEQQKNAVKTQQQGAGPNSKRSGGDPQKAQRASGRPTGTSEINRGPRSEANTFSVQDITEVIKDFDKFIKGSVSIYKDLKGSKRISKAQKETIESLCEKIMVSKESQEWEETLSNVIKNPSLLLDMQIHEEIAKIAEEHNLDDYSASILYHSTLNKCKED